MEGGDRDTAGAIPAWALHLSADEWDEGDDDYENPDEELAERQLRHGRHQISPRPRAN